MAQYKKKAGRPKAAPNTKKMKENFSISPEVKVALRTEAEKTRLSMSSIVEQALRAFLDK